MKFKKETLLELTSEGVGVEVDGLLVVFQGKWRDDGKYSRQQTVFSCEGKHYQVWESRSGSYFSDYYYDSENWPEEVECDEVEPVEVTVTEWRKKK